MSKCHVVLCLYVEPQLHEGYPHHSPLEYYGALEAYCRCESGDPADYQ
jgi:hypothetical protein